jgi:methionyl-tRNA formyltransferase
LQSSTRSPKTASQGIQLVEKSDAKFVLCGSGKTMCEFAGMLVERGYPKPLILTHPKGEHARDLEFFDSPRCSDMQASVFQCAEEFDLDVLEIKQVNRELALTWLGEHGANMAISFGCRSIFRRPFLDAFDGLVFNCHSTDIPRFRGAATQTWLVLHDEPKIYGTIHLVDEGLDSGDVLIKLSRPRQCDAPYPIDYMRETHAATIEALQVFLNQLESGEELPRTPLDLEQGTYFPRLNTEQHGAIDWNWPGKHIDRFVRAFGWPYPGAFSYVQDKKITIGEVISVGENEPFHPFAAGLIYRTYPDGSVAVVSGDGGIRVNSLRQGKDERRPADFLKEGARLMTPIQQLESSRSFNAKY